MVFNSRLRLFPGKLRTRWDGPYEILEVAPHGAVKLFDPKTGNTFKVNGQRVKPYFEISSDQREVDHLELTLTASTKG